MQFWPSVFPQRFLVNGLTLDPVSNAMPVDVESGQPMSRARFTGAMDDVAGKIHATPAMADQILAFYRIDCRQGSQPFGWQHPITGETAVFLFLEPPKAVPVSSGLWLISMRLRSLPR